MSTSHGGEAVRSWDRHLHRRSSRSVDSRLMLKWNFIGRWNGSREVETCGTRRVGSSTPIPCLSPSFNWKCDTLSFDLELGANLSAYSARNKCARRCRRRTAARPRDPGTATSTNFLFKLEQWHSVDRNHNRRNPEIYSDGGRPISRLFRSVNFPYAVQKQT
jgi:hypothetical protein